MKRNISFVGICVLVIVLFAASAFAEQEVKFAFDKSINDTPGGEEVAEYLMYRSPASGSYDMTEGKAIQTVVADGSATYTCTVTLPDGFSFVVVTARGPNGESEPSQEVRCFCRTTTTGRYNSAISPPISIIFER